MEAVAVAEVVAVAFLLPVHDARAAEEAVLTAAVGPLLFFVTVRFWAQS
jgi:hypothetical protein